MKVVVLGSSSSGNSTFVNINNTNTNWVLKTKCLETFDCTTCDPSIFDIDPYETQLMFDEFK